MENYIDFGKLKFKICGDYIRLISFYGNRVTNGRIEGCHFVELQIAGENHNAARGAKQFQSSEFNRLKYLSHNVTDNVFTIIQRSELVEVETIFQRFGDTDALRIYNRVTNISARAVCLEHVSSFVCYGFGENGQNDCNNLYFYRFTNGHHCECQPRILSFFDCGLFNNNGNKSAKRIAGCNTGSWSSKEELPQGIIEDRNKKSFFMFQIESDNSWYYEISDDCGMYYLNLGGANDQFNQWSKVLLPGEKFETVKVAVASGKSLNDVIKEMTVYRRHIVRYNRADAFLPTIFNEYMHLSWDSPNEDQTFKIAKEVSKFGVDYYVIDCGWHNEEDGNIIYPYVGQWKESKKRFPHGIKYTIDYIHSLGMKAGLWLEPEIIGYLCEEMQKYYPDDCFFVRNGKRITEMGRQFLDFRNPKVRDYLTETVRRLVEDYGADYLKFDYNQDCGAGTELYSDSLGDGLQGHRKAYYEWVIECMDKYPDLIIETCSSGGLKMDYHTLSVHPIVSTSDQTNYRKYPYIAANILSAVLPEQAAVWSYPVETDFCAGGLKNNFTILPPDRIGEEAVAMNMVNSFLGRVHLASRVDLLNDRNKRLVHMGLDYLKKIAEVKKKAFPFFPLGFCNFNVDCAASGFYYGDTLYLAVWNMKKAKTVEIPLGDWAGRKVQCVYPDFSTDYCFCENTLTVAFSVDYGARFFEITGSVKEKGI